MNPKEPKFSPVPGLLAGLFRSLLRCLGISAKDESWPPLGAPVDWCHKGHGAAWCVWIKGVVLQHYTATTLQRYNLTCISVVEEGHREARPASGSGAGCGAGFPVA